MELVARNTSVTTNEGDRHFCNSWPGAVVDRVANRHSVFARRKGLSLEASRPELAVSVSCEDTAAERVLSNLVENAVRHGPEGGHASIVLTSRDGAFTLRVLSDGAQIAPEEMQRLTVRTVRGEAARGRQTLGRGLGLGIVAAICERCGFFTLAFSSPDSGGLEVTVQGPIAA